MRMINVVVPGSPVGKERARSGGGHFYTPKKTKAWESHAGWLLRARAEVHQTHHGIAAIAVNSVTKRPNRIIKARGEGRILRMTTPDADNVLKACCDAAQLSTLIKDDRQIAVQNVMNWYGALDEEPCVEICLALIGDTAGDRLCVGSLPVSTLEVLERLLR